jgi:addiction module HigA family antidote
MSGPPIHPGEILADELDEIGLSATALARRIDVPPNRISEIIRGRRNITGDTALRLGHWFKTSPRFWVNLQTAYDLRLAAQQAGAAIEKLPTRQDHRQAGPVPQPGLL